MTRLHLVAHSESAIGNEQHNAGSLMVAGPIGLIHAEYPLARIEVLTAEEANQLCKYSSFFAIEAMQSHPNFQAFALASRGLWGLVSIAQTSKTLSKQQLLKLSQRYIVQCNKKEASSTEKPAPDRSAPEHSPLPAKLQAPLSMTIKVSSLSLVTKNDPLPNTDQPLTKTALQIRQMKPEFKTRQLSQTDAAPTDLKEIPDSGALSSDVDASMTALSMIQEKGPNTFQFLEKITPPVLGLTGEILVSSSCLSTSICSTQLASQLGAGGLTLLALNAFLRAGLAIKTARELTNSLAKFNHSQASTSVRKTIEKQLTENRNLKYFSAITASGTGIALIVTIIAPPVGCAIFTPFLIGNLVANQLERQAETPITPPDKVAHCNAPEILLSMAFDHLTRQIETMSGIYLKRFSTKPEAVLHSIAQQFQNHIFYLNNVLEETNQEPAGLYLARDAAHIGRPQQLNPEQTLSEEMAGLSNLVSALMHPNNMTNEGCYQTNSQASLNLLHAFWQGSILKPGANSYWEKRWKAWGITHRKLGANTKQLFDVKKLSILTKHPSNKKILSGLYAITFQYFVDLKIKKQHTKNIIGGMLLRKSTPSHHVI